MSRIGSNPVAVPDGVSVEIAGQNLTAKGKLGELSMILVDVVEATLEGDRILIAPRGGTLRARKMWGTTRSLVNSLVAGVSEGFSRVLEINGVGYRAAVQDEDLVLQLGIPNRVRFHGEASDADLPLHYQRAHLFVLPANARSEAFGGVLLEAMASGLPCVTTDVGTGTSWVVQNGLTGSVVPPRDPLALGGAIRDILSSPSRRLQMGRAGRVRVESDFTLEQMISRVLAVYEEVLPVRS